MDRLLNYPATRAPLAQTPFIALPLGAIDPRGWLLGQLKLQAMGITGYLYDIWDDVGPNSGWLGGSGEGWERGPYYLDGLVPLAFLLKDDRLLSRAKRFVDWSLQSRRPDGCFGPASRPDWWARIPMLKALMQYYEATEDERVIDLLSHYFRYELNNLPSQPLSDWGEARAGDNIYCVYWLYNRTGEAFLLDLAHLLHKQSLDWTSIYHTMPYRDYQTKFDHRVHVVNAAMGLKEPGLYYLLSREEQHRDAPRAGLANLERFHGLANGLFSGDEWLAGRDPSQGTETCAVVELMFSLEILIRTLGDPTFADHLEKVAYNALPASQTPDAWGHQYDQQPNQVLVSCARRNWTANNDSSNLFGLAPNYGCCTANLHQGWPKLTTSLWAATPDGGLAALVYAPCAVTARVGRGVEVTITEETDYPFNGTIRLVVRVPDKAESDVEFPLTVRVPGWATGASLLIGDEPPVPVEAGQFHRIARLWHDGDSVTLELPQRIRISRWHQQAVSVERGPLVYAVQVGESWRKIGGVEPCPDWEVHPTTPWNYGLIVDEQNPDTSFRVEANPVVSQPFDSVNAPIRLVAKGKRLPQWQLVDNSAGPLPASPTTSAEPTEEVTLVPYGCARLRVSEIPEVRD